MADTKTSAETAAATLTGAELIRAVQSAANVKATVDQIKTYVTSAGAGGSTGQPLWNNGNAIAGMAGASWDDTNRALTQTGATVTTSKPVASYTQTWNAGAVTFTGWKLNVTNTASAVASLLFDFQLGGASKMALYANNANFGLSLADGMISSPAGYMRLNSQGISGRYSHHFGYQGETYIVSAGIVGWASSATIATSGVDSAFYRKAAKIIAICDGTINSHNGTAFSTGSQTVTNLPVAATAGPGARSYVTDATLAHAAGVGTTVAGGGANSVPVVSNGTNWIIG